MAYIVKAAGMRAWWRVEPSVGGFWDDSPETAHRFTTQEAAQRFAQSCAYEVEVIGVAA